MNAVLIVDEENSAQKVRTTLMEQRDLLNLITELADSSVNSLAGDRIELIDDSIA